MKNIIMQIIIKRLPTLSINWIENFTRSIMLDIKELALAGDDIDSYIEFAVSNINL
jgi:hypothetical protein